MVVDICKFGKLCIEFVRYLILVSLSKVCYDVLKGLGVG